MTTYDTIRNALPSARITTVPSANTYIVVIDEVASVTLRDFGHRVRATRTWTAPHVRGVPASEINSALLSALSRLSAAGLFVPASMIVSASKSI